MALVVFSALIILSKQSNEAEREKDIQLWVENTTAITFPRFHVRLDHRSPAVFINNNCYSSGVPLVPQACQSWDGFQPPMNQCIAFNSDEIVGVNDMSRDDSRISCTVTTTNGTYQGNMMMVFELEGQNVFSWGGNAYAGLWFGPNNNAWIMLEKNLLQATKHHEVFELWSRTLLYHSTASSTGYYNFTVIMGSYFVRHFEPKDTYNGWMTVGNIGGVGFFMVIIHTLAMIILGLFLSNTSTFLSGGSDSKY